MQEFDLALASECADARIIAEKFKQVSACASGLRPTSKFVASFFPIALKDSD
jgi:hypothetical protein